MPAEIWSGGVREVWASGIVPQTTDSRRVLWLKKLLVILGNSADPDPDNYPMIGDPIRVLKLKCVRAANDL